MKKAKNIQKEYGDFQTPYDFAFKVCDYLKSVLNINPKFIIEPTCGVGGFVKASFNTFSKLEQVLGIEINQDHCEEAKTSVDEENFKVVNQSIFDYNFDDNDIKDDTLVIGNPPWANNSRQEFNLPQKGDSLDLFGLEAFTGVANYDICESIIEKMIDAFASRNKVATFAFLCKNSVARKIFAYVCQKNIGCEYVKILNIDAKKIFDVDAVACLLVIKFNFNIKDPCECEVLNFDDAHAKLIDEKYTKLRVDPETGNVVKAGVDFTLDGKCTFEWRQGIKHDLADIMELTRLDRGKYKNKLGQIIELEDDLVFPLVKSSDIKNPKICGDFKRYVIVTQKKLRQNTSYIEKKSPKTCDYLKTNQELFESRKSSIYKDKPKFSMFGIGDYTYAPYKVAVSAFYKKPLFTLLYNKDNKRKPVMVDDTVYFLPFDSFGEAYACMLMLNTDLVQDFLMSISFEDAKRPFTKKLLQRIDFCMMIEKIFIDDLKRTEKELGLKAIFKNEMSYDFCDLLPY